MSSLLGIRLRFHRSHSPQGTLPGPCAAIGENCVSGYPLTDCGGADRRWKGVPMARRILFARSRGVWWTGSGLDPLNKALEVTCDVVISLNMSSYVWHSVPSKRHPCDLRHSSTDAFREWTEPHRRALIGCHAIDQSVLASGEDRNMGRLGFEPRTNRLKAECSTAELATRALGHPRNVSPRPHLLQAPCRGRKMGLRGAGGDALLPLA